jgi:hypothetical protein
VPAKEGKQAKQYNLPHYAWLCDFRIVSRTAAVKPGAVLHYCYWQVRRSWVWMKTHGKQSNFLHLKFKYIYKLVRAPCLRHRYVPPRMPPRCFSYPLTLGLHPSVQSSKIWHGAFCFTEWTILKEWNALWPWKLN